MREGSLKTNKNVLHQPDKTLEAKCPQAAKEDGKKKKKVFGRQFSGTKGAPSLPVLVDKLL